VTHSLYMGPKGSSLLWNNAQGWKAIGAVDHSVKWSLFLPGRVEHSFSLESLHLDY
jgi:hypothetical protein